jgi:hypothetical protein
MRKTQFKNHGEVIAALYRLIGQMTAVQIILDPLTDEDAGVDRSFAVRMIIEAAQRDLDDLMHAADLPNPVLVLTLAGDAESDGHGAAMAN